MVTTGTTEALLVVFGPHELEPARLHKVLELTAARMHEFTGGTAHALTRSGGYP
jgi:DNA/RNA-binding domain of Phe-tRNA-synthetase-like protein